MLPRPCDDDDGVHDVLVRHHEHHQYRRPHPYHHHQALRGLLLLCCQASFFVPRQLCSWDRTDRKEGQSLRMQTNKYFRSHSHLYTFVWGVGSMADHHKTASKSFSIWAPHPYLRRQIMPACVLASVQIFDLLKHVRECRAKKLNPWNFIGHATAAVGWEVWEVGHLHHYYFSFAGFPHHKMVAPVSWNISYSNHQNFLERFSCKGFLPIFLNLDVAILLIPNRCHLRSSADGHVDKWRS